MNIVKEEKRLDMKSPTSQIPSKLPLSHPASGNPIVSRGLKTIASKNQGLLIAECEFCTQKSLKAMPSERWYVEWAETRKLRVASQSFILKRRPNAQDTIAAPHKMSKAMNKRMSCVKGEGHIRRR